MLIKGYKFSDKTPTRTSHVESKQVDLIGEIL
jgi:hypothetical protein